jgi:hypothetical protein
MPVRRGRASPVVSTRWRKIRPAVRPGGPLRRKLQKHGGTIIAVVCFVIAAYLAVKGVRGL